MEFRRPFGLESSESWIPGQPSWVSKPRSRWSVYQDSNFVIHINFRENNVTHTSTPLYFNFPGAEYLLGGIMESCRKS